MSRPKCDTPTYCLHKRSGRAYVTLNGKQRLLPGLYASPESRAAYDRLIAEWLNGGRTLPTAKIGPTVSMICAAFFQHAQAYYRHPDGTDTGETVGFKNVIRPLRRMYGETPAAEFGPRMLKAFRSGMLHDRVDPGTGKVLPGWSRTYCNHQVKRVQMIFRWAVGEEKIPASTYEALRAVDSIRAGKEGARETAPVEPVAVHIVEATMPYLPPPVAALVKLQLLTGARGGELFRLRTCDIDRTGPVWKYRPAAHKTAHHGQRRTIYFGPKAQAILTPILKLDLQAYLFTPAEAVEWRNARQAKQRKTPLTPSQRSRAAEAAKRLRKLHPFYNRDSYARAIARACDLAFPPPVEMLKELAQLETAKPPDAKALAAAEAALRDWRRRHRWHPHQLRHTAATLIRREGDLEAAKIVLGHQTEAMTERYAERDTRRAEEIMVKIG